MFKILFFSALLLTTTLAFLPDYSDLPEVVSVSGVLNHFIAFFTLYILFERSYPQLTCKERIFLLLIYAVFIEAVQYFLPTRAAEIMDVIVDTLGILSAYFLLPILKKRKTFAFLI